MRTILCLIAACIAVPIPQPFPATNNKDLTIGTFVGAAAIGLASLNPGVRSAMANMATGAQSAGIRIGRQIYGFGRSSLIPPMAAEPPVVIPRTRAGPVQPDNSWFAPDVHIQPVGITGVAQRANVPVQPLENAPIIKMMVPSPMNFEKAINVPTIKTLDPKNGQMVSQPVPRIVNPVDVSKYQSVDHSLHVSLALPPLPPIMNPIDVSKIQGTVRPQVLPQAIINHPQIIKPIEHSKSQLMLHQGVSPAMNSAPPMVRPFGPSKSQLMVRPKEELPLAINSASQSSKNREITNPHTVAWPTDPHPIFKVRPQILENPFAITNAQLFNPAQSTKTNLLTVNEFLDTHQSGIRPPIVFKIQPLNQPNPIDSMLLLTPFLRPIVKKFTTKNAL